MRASYILCVLILLSTSLLKICHCAGNETSSVGIETSSAVSSAAAAATLDISTSTTIATPINSITTNRPTLPPLKLPCSCFAGQCGCCTGMILDRFKQKACMNVTYDPDEFSLTGSMSMNNRVLYKNTFSGKNPPPMCIRVPRFRFITFCVEFSNIYLARRNIHMCINAEATWDDFTLVEWSFDCIRLGASGVAVIAPEEGGGLPLSSIDQVPQIDEDYDDSARHVTLHSTKVTDKFTVKKLRNGVAEITFNNIIDAN